MKKLSYETENETYNGAAAFGLVWNADLTLKDDTAGAAQRRREAIAQARASRPRTAQLEREIIQAVIVLYLLILGSFAGLHLYGRYIVAMQPQQVESTQSEPIQAEPGTR
jgi:hypothetical protein